MTRKDFELIARTIAGYRKVSGIWADEIALRFADTLAGTNPNFNRRRFLDACGCKDA